MKKPRFKFFRKKTVLFVIIIILLIIVGFLYILIEKNKILSFSIAKLSTFYGVKNLKLNIEKLDFTGVHINSVRVGDDDNNGIIAKDISLSFAENGNPHIINISGMCVNVWNVNGKIIIPGIPLGAKSSLPKGNHFSEVLPAILKIPEYLAPSLEPGTNLKIKNSIFSFNIIKNSKILSLKLPFSLELNLDKYGKYTSSFSMNLNNLNISLPDIGTLKLISGLMNFKSSGIIYENKNAESLNADFYISLKQIDFKNKNIYIKIPYISLNGHALQINKTMQCDLNLSLKHANAIFGKNKINDLNAEIPLFFTYTNKLIMNHISAQDENGSISIDNIDAGLIQSGPLNFILKQNGNNFSIDGICSPSFFKSSNHYFDIHSDIFFNLINFSFTAESTINADNLSFDLAFIKPELSKFNIDFKDFQLHSIMQFAKKQTLSASIKLAGANLINITDNIKLQNLNIDCNFPNLYNKKSDPKQKILFSSLNIGNLSFESGSIDFQIESPSEIFLEKTNINWCDGQIDLGALRFNLAKPENIDFTLFCDRINVAKLIRQLHLAEAEGKGLVAGRIPLNYKPGQLRINNAFLYSIPGEGGNIKITDFDKSYLALASASAPLDITKEALADYNYKWIKLFINSKGPFLFIKLQMDGKPNRKLPFTYNSEIGFVKSLDSKNTALFKGISFDFNFNNIPIDSLLNLNDSTKKFFK